MLLINSYTHRTGHYEVNSTAGYSADNILMNLLLYLGLVLQLDLCYCVFCTRELELTKGFVISLFTTMALLGIHGADIVNELIHRIEENFEDVPVDNRSRDACKIGRFAKLRYLHRQLLKPPNVPRTPLPGLTRRLYRLYGHYYTQLASALEGHVVCWIVTKAVRLSASLSIGFRLSCYILGLVFIVSTFIAVHMFCIVTILLTLMLMQLLWIALDYGNTLRDEFQKLYPPPSDYSHLVAMFYGILIAIGAYCVLKVLESVYFELRTKLQGDIADYKFCRLCFLKPRTQYFPPCRHLVSCSSCSNKIKKCPVCGEREITAETRVQPLTTNVCVLCNTQDVSRLLVPCGHVVCCTPCASQLDDCPVCWEEVTDDKHVFLS